MDIDGAGAFEDALHFVEAGVEPDKVAVQPALPDVVERAQFVVVAPDDIVLPAGEKGRVNVNQIHAVSGNLPHYMQVVAPNQAVGFVGLVVAQPHPFHNLHREVDQGVVAAKVLPAVPAFGFGFYGDIAETDGGTVELLLAGQRFVAAGVVVGRFGFRFGVGVGGELLRHRYSL